MTSMTSGQTRINDAFSIQVTAACLAIGALAELIMRIDPSLTEEVRGIAKELARELASCMLILGGDDA